MSHDALKALYDVGRTQLDLVTTRQLRALGVAPSTIASWKASGLIRSVRYGVHAVGSTRFTWERALMATVLAAGDGAGASHESAARLHGFPGFWASRPEVTIPAHRRPHLSGVLLHRSKTWDPDALVTVQGIPASRPSRTWIDLSARMSADRAGRIVDDLIRRDLVDLDALREEAGQVLARGGRTRAAHVLAVLDARHPDAALAESIWEEWLHDLLVAAGLPAPVRQHRVVVAGRHYRLDLAYPEHRIAIEFDGFEGHRVRSRFDSDRVRSGHLQSEGWMVLAFTSASPADDVVELVRRALQRRAA